MSKSPCSLFHPLAGQEIKLVRDGARHQKSKRIRGDIDCQVRAIDQTNGRKNKWKSKNGEIRFGKAMMQTGRKEAERTNQELMLTGFNIHGYPPRPWSPCQEEKLFISCSINQMKHFVSWIWNVFLNGESKNDPTLYLYSSHMVEFCGGGNFLILSQSNCSQWFPGRHPFPLMTMAVKGWAPCCD